VCHLWSWIKFHINNVIYFRINCTRELSFFRIYRLYITVQTQSFSHGSFEKKNWSELFMWDRCGRLYVCMYTAYPYLYVVHYLHSPPMVSLQNHGPFLALVSCVFPLFLHCGATVAWYSCVAPPPYDCTCNEVFMITDVG
jgi:hypothetical protein